MNNQPLTVFAAGSLKAVLSEIIIQFEAQFDSSVRCHFGPAGLLARKIQRGSKVDLFASANESHPDLLVRQQLLAPGKVFATNQLCIITRPELHVTQDNLLSRLIDPNIVLSTSKPGSDPGGDYAQMFFDRVEQLHHGLGEMMRNKAQHLLGGHIPAFSTTQPASVPTAARLILDRRSDIHVGYASNIPLMKSIPGLHTMLIPDLYQITAHYKFALGKQVTPELSALADSLTSKTGKNILSHYGFGIPQPVKMSA
ncbi:MULTISPECIES: substrate-binding domain-containing protein [Vibrio]|uniref:Molybdate ABC transporter substrate-binding protein n=2 Tax=Vibrio TaxID=662 RepID=A0A7X4LLX9_9VIBR|nr:MULTISPECIES: substrate-binding domain-containing protein [Vibrio]MBF9000164.1 substrate-binding domain-containing protein [Vibrio nitrifigilis]MZI94408.1 molybdate ABC transporter substrate-binding protein [Vibrio eleionomae]